MSIYVLQARAAQNAYEPVLSCAPNHIRPTLDFLSQFKVLKQKYIFWGKKYVIHKKNKDIVYVKKSALHEGAYGKIYLMEITNFDLANTLRIPTHLTLKTFKPPHDIEEYNKEKNVLDALHAHDCDENAWVRAAALDKTVLMEKMGATLDSLRGKFNFTEACKIVLQMARALKCLYDAGFPYCDMKTYNVLICCEENTYRVLIGDFGSAAPHPNGLYSASYTPFYTWQDVEVRKIGFVTGTQYNVLFGLFAAAIRITEFFDDEYAPKMFFYMKRARYGKSTIESDFKKLNQIDSYALGEVTTWINLCPDEKYRAFLNACLDKEVTIQRVIEILQ